MYENSGLAGSWPVLDDSLRSCKARNGDSRCRAGDVIETRQMAELDGIGVAAVLSTDTDFNPGVRLATKNYSDAHKLAHALLINALEGINVQNLGIKVGGQEGSSSIITAVGKGLSLIHISEPTRLGMISYA